MLRPTRILLATLFIVAGICHFVFTAQYLAIVPPWLPKALVLVYVSGVAEILGGLGVLYRLTRRAAGAGLIVLLLAVFPANVYAAMHGMSIAGHALNPWLLWARLPMQALLLYWVHAVAWKAPSPPRG